MKFYAMIDVDEAKLAKSRGTESDECVRNAVEEELGRLAESGIRVMLLEDSDRLVVRQKALPKLSDIRMVGPILDIDKLVLGRIEFDREYYATPGDKP